MTQVIEVLSSALASRLRDVAHMLDRLDRLESGTGEWLASQTAGDLTAEATEATLRALRVAADPSNFAILTLLSGSSAAPMAWLQDATGLGRLALSERVNDLVQVGLAIRHIDTDQVQSTSAGAALLGWIGGIGEAAAQKLAAALPGVSR